MSRALHIVLVHPEIHWNTGNVGRTCLALDAQLHLIEPLGFGLDDRRVRRAGLDYWPRVAPRIWRDCATFEDELPRLGTPYAVTPEADRSLYATRFDDRVVLLFGAESTGLPQPLRCRYPGVRLPMADPQLRSLNLSTTVAVAGFEVVRQHGGGATAATPAIGECGAEPDS